MSYPVYIDFNKFRGFALVNWSTKELAVTIRNESTSDVSFIMKPKDIYYCRVADVVEFTDLDWAKKSLIRNLRDIKELKDRRGRLR